MKAPRASCEGYLTLRTSPSSPPPMLRRYCFLVGTCFYYYSTQEDAYHMLRLKGEVDVLGVQDWDGKGNMHIYQHGFLFATAQNKVFYAYADTAVDKEKWMRAIQIVVETTMPRMPLVLSHSGPAEALSPSGVAVAMSDADATCKCPHCCAIDGALTIAAVAAASTTATAPINASVTAAAPPPVPTSQQLLYKCYNCEMLFCERFTTNKVSLPHRSFYYAKRVCDDCYDAQQLVNYLKAIVERLKAGICLYPKPLDPHAPIELIMPQRPSHTEAANIAINMLKAGVITAEECEVILFSDKRYLNHTMTEHPEIPLDLKILALHREFRSRAFSVYRAVILLHRHLDSDPLLFKPIVEKLLHFSFTRINQVEFYWPQIVHAYLSVPMFDFEKVFWLDELIFSICSRSIHLALLLRWQLQGALEDAFEPSAPKNMQDKFARVVRLLVDVEREVVGTEQAALLSRSPSERSRRSRLPMPTEQQLALIERMTDEIAAYRRDAHAGNDASRVSAFAPSSLSPDAAAIAAATNNDSDNRFRDFSRFQQHLLTPKHTNLLLGGDSDDNDNDALSLSAVIEEEDMVETQPTSLFRSTRARSSSSSSNNSREISESTSTTRRMSHAEKSVLSQYFADECDFVQQITDIAEVLRFVPTIQDRKKQLPGYLAKIRLPPMAYVPLVKATDPFERIVRIPTNEGTAFSTKARVPILLIFEVIRGNYDPSTTETMPATTANTSTTEQQALLSPTASPDRPSFASAGSSSNGLLCGSSNNNAYADDDEVDRLIRHQAPDGFAAAAADTVSETKDDDDAPPQLPQPLVMDVSPPAARTRNVTSVPETPIDVMSNVATPSSSMPLLHQPLQRDESHVSLPAVDRATAAVAQLALNIAAVATDGSSETPTTLTDDALERENARRKDLEAAFGESWSSKRLRLQAASPFGHVPGWDIVSMIGKSNDDLRQEVFTLQLIQKFIEIFRVAKLPLWLRSYRIIATSSSTGLIETLANAISLDGLKKRDGYVSLLHHFEKSYGPNVTSSRFQDARRKFIQSMAGYSVVSYLLQIKDRHNGNIMLDNEGHIIHIDYGFLLGIAPGGSFSIETAPFKLTSEMVDVMGGADSDGFNEYVQLCTRAFLACQQHCDEICDLVDIMAQQSPYPCFAGKDVNYILLRLRSRFKLTLSKEETVAHVLSLIRKSNSNYSTRQYDNFQRMTNGILP